MTAWKDRQQGEVAELAYCKELRTPWPKGLEGSNPSFLKSLEKGEAMYYTGNDIEKICKEFSSDFNKLNKTEKHLVQQEAEKWIKAFQKACPQMLKEPLYKML
jgi:hypothetical protein